MALSASLRAKLSQLRQTPPRIWIAVFKGTLAYMILVIMAFSSRVRSGFNYPIVLTSATVVVVAGFPGANYGQVIGAVVFALSGVGMGAVAFVILAKLAHVPVAQGIVFTLIVYGFALLKAKSMKFFGMALLGILVSFAGIYTSLSLPGHPFSPEYLEDYLKSYTLGGAIVLAVNFLILPISSEKELRRTLVTSLNHIRTFSHLLAKSYSLELDEEERSVRDGMAQSIRADFGVLQQKMGSTTLEINYSKYSMDDYRTMIQWTQRLQQQLIGTYSTVTSMEKLWTEQENSLFRREFIPTTRASFTLLRKEITQAIREISKVLGEGISVEELPEYEDYRGESNTPHDKAEAGKSTFDIPVPQKRRKHADTVMSILDSGLRRRLESEVGISPTPMHGRSPAVSRRPSISEAGPNGGTDGLQGQANTPSEGAALPASGPGSGASSTVFPGMSTTATRITSQTMSSLVMSHYKFRDSQQDILAHLLCSGEIRASDDNLRLETKQPTMAERFSAKAEQEAKKKVELKNRKNKRIPEVKESHASDEPKSEASDAERSQGRLLISVTSFMFLLGQFTRDLDHLHMFVAGEIGIRKRKRIHVHVFENAKPNRSPFQPVPGSSGPVFKGLPNANEPAKEEGKVNGTEEGHADLQMHEALALLEGRTPVFRKKKTLFGRIVDLERMARSDVSLIALKTAAAAIAYAAILLAPSSRAFFIQYTLTGGVLSVVVAMSPSLGQTYFTFINQIIGTISGNVYGMVLLYIFHDVAGYKWNPYGIACMLIPFAALMSYLININPPFFSLGLLALNGANLTIFTTIFYQDLPTYTDPPALRAGKAMVAMCIGLGIAFAFQFMVLRSPARRLLRQAVADLVSSITAYYILHSAYVSSINPEPEGMDGKRAPLEIVKTVSQELSKRERTIQGQIIDIYPLLNFAKLEPEFGGGEFRGDLYKRITSSAQLLMDRLREARVIITTYDEDHLDASLDPSVFYTIPAFQPMASYRRMHNRLMKHRLYLLTTALQSKTPLPQDSLASRFVPYGVTQHDILVLTQRLIRDEGGRETIRSTAFLRLISYMLAVGNWRSHVDQLEEAVGELLGVWEDDEFL